MRLAFAVAAHLEPDILLVDEVLAVGDAAFQKKCLGKMGDVVKQGRTVLFISHNMTAVEALCEQVIVIDRGHIVWSGDTRKGLEFYVSHDVAKQTFVDLRNHRGRRSGMHPVISGLRIMNTKRIETTAFRLCEDVIFEVEIDPGHERYPSGAVAIGLYSSFGQLICSMKSSIQSPATWQIREPGKIRCVLRDIRLVPGRYVVGVAFSNHRTTLDWVDEVTSVEVIAADTYGTGQSSRMTSGFVVPDVIWDADAQFKSQP